MLYNMYLSPFRRGDEFLPILDIPSSSSLFSLYFGISHSSKAGDFSALSVDAFVVMLL